MKYVLAVMLALWAASLAAQVPFGRFGVVETRFGGIWVEQRGQWAQRLVRDGTPLPLGEQEMFWVRGVYQGDANSDYVIVSSNHSGNMCGGYVDWFLLRVTANDTAMSQPIGACTSLTNVRVEEGVLLFDRAHPDLTISREVLAWDGATLTSELIPAPVEAPAGAGTDVTRWLGQYTYQMFADASERARLGQMMPAPEVQALSAHTGLSDVMEQRGDWVFASGCMRHACNLEMGALGLRISDGAVAVALWSNGAPSRAYGLSDNPDFQSFVAERMQ